MRTRQVSSDSARSVSRRRACQKCLAILISVTGILLMLYPWISNRLYEHAEESAAAGYEAAVEAAPSETIAAYWENARIYNERLLESNVVISDPFTYENIGMEQDLEYDNLLNADGSGIMCFVEIPKIDICLPVFHGTSYEVLAKGAGHVEGTALPVGTEGGRPVICAHTGVNSARMFSDLVHLETGDIFLIRVLDETLAYRVTEVLIIEPDDVSSVQPQEGRDLVSLMTCTPYGINTQRLIVTGERTGFTQETWEEAYAQTMENGTEWMKAYRNALLISLAILAGVSGGVTIARRRRRRL